MKRHLSILLFFLCIQSIYCQQVDNMTLRTVIENWISRSELFQQKNPGASINRIEPISNDDGTPSLMHLVSLTPNGYIIVTNNEKLPVVISFSPTNSPDESNLKEGPLAELIKGTQTHLLQIISKSNTDEKVINNIDRWRVLKNNAAKALKASRIAIDNPTTIIESFVDVHWGQAKPYNRYAPACPDNTGDKEQKAPSGCVVMAMTQVMKYYNWPTRGVAQKNYTNTGNLSAELYSDYSLQYDWDKIKSRYNEAGKTDTDLEKSAVGKLVFDIGVATNMNYECSGSSAGYEFTTLNNQLLYNFPQEISKTDFTVLKETISKLQPVLLGIPGHAVVIDGYAVQDATEYFHINYGWGGLSDNWYDLQSGTPQIVTLYNDMIPQPIAVFQPMKYSQASGFQLKWDIPEYYEKGIEGYSIDNFRIKQGTWNSNIETIAIPNDSWIASSDGQWKVSENESPKYTTNTAGWPDIVTTSLITSKDAYLITAETSLSFIRKKETIFGSTYFKTEIMSDNSGNWIEIDEEGLSENERKVNISLSKYAGKSIKIRFTAHWRGNGQPGSIWVTNTQLSNAYSSSWTTIADNLAGTARSYQVNSANANNSYLYQIESKYNNEWYTSPVIEEVKITPTNDEAPTLSFDNDIITYTFENSTDCSIPLQIADAETPLDQLEVSTFYCNRPDVFNASLSRFIPDENGNGHGTLKLYPRLQAGTTLIGVMVKDAAGNTTKKLITVELKDATPPAETNSKYYVTPTGSGDYSGTSWENASSDLEVILDRASHSSATEKPIIYVASGTVTGNFTMVEGINVYGGYNPETGLQDLTKKTILDGNQIRILTQPKTFTTPTTWQGFEFVNGGRTKSDSYVGGILLHDGGVIDGCIIHDNKIGGIYCVDGGIIKNSVIFGNDGPGITLNAGNGQIINCVITNNSKDKGVVINENGTMVNSIVWNNDATIGDNASFSCTYSALPTVVTGEGNIILNTTNNAEDGPNFTDWENGDYSLLSSSPCINKGNNEFTSEIDILGKSRIRFQTIDMGAYELQGLTVISGTTVDLNNFSSNNILDADLTIHDGGNVTYSTDLTVNGKITFCRSFESSDKWYSMICPYNATLYIGETAVTPEKYELRIQEASGQPTWETSTEIMKGRAFLIKVSAELAGQTISFVSEENEILNNVSTQTEAPTDENLLLLCGNLSLKTMTTGDDVILLPSKDNPELFARMEGKQNIAIFNAYLLGNAHNKAETANVAGEKIKIQDRIFAYYVTPDGAGDNSGLSWENAAKDINQAIENASNYKAPTSDFKPVVYVSSGTFMGNFTMAEGINVYGSYDTTTNQPDYKNRTILNGDGSRVISQSGQYSIPTTWSGFEIMNGGKGTGTNDNFGGGVLLYNNGIIDKCYIHGNKKNGQWDGIHHGGGVACYQGGIIMNSIITDNSSMSNGAGVFLQSSGQVINCVIANNSGANGGIAMLYGGTMTNSIVWKNALSGSATYSAIDGDNITGEGNIKINSNNDAVDGPNFTDWEHGDFSLKSSSPCIDKGDNSAVMTEDDYLGNPRIRCQQVDMGAYESQKTYVYNEETGEISLMEWTPAFLDDVVPTDITSIDATTIQIPSGAMQPAGLNPNSLIYVNSLENTGSLSNVVLTNGEEGTAENIVLEDGYSFYNTKNIIANNISYSRNFLDGWNTFALPFNTSITEGDKVEEFGDAQKGSIKFNAATEITANTAYLINIPKSANKVFTATGNVSVPPTTVTGSIFKSNFKKLTGEKVAGKYILDLIDNTEIFAKASTKATLPAFRGYLELPEGNISFQVIHDDGPTTIDPANTISLLTYSVNGNLIIISNKAQTVRLYGIDGRLIRILELMEGENTFNTLPKGIYMIEHHKIIIK